MPAARSALPGAVVAALLTFLAMAAVMAAGAAWFMQRLRLGPDPDPEGFVRSTYRVLFVVGPLAAALSYWAGARRR